MKLSTLSEYGAEATPQLEVNAQQMRAASHGFYEIINQYFEGASPGWSHSRVEVGYRGKTLSIAVRYGVNEGTQYGEKLTQKPETTNAPKVAIEPSWDGTVEMRLNVPQGYREQIDWSREKGTAIGVISMQIGSGQLKDAIATAANNIIQRMQKAGRITDYP